MDKTKTIILGLLVVAMVAAWFVFIAPKLGGTIPDNRETNTTVTLPNGTVKQITGISGFPAGSGGSSSDTPPTPPE